MSSYQYRESHCGDKTVVRSPQWDFLVLDRRRPYIESGPWCLSTPINGNILSRCKIVFAYDNCFIISIAVKFWNTGNLFHQYSLVDATSIICGIQASTSIAMITSPNGNIYFSVFFDLRLNKRFNKQSRRRWFETPSLSLLRHCNVALAKLSL